MSIHISIGIVEIAEEDLTQNLAKFRLQFAWESERNVNYKGIYYIY